MLAVLPLQFLAEPAGVELPGFSGGPQVSDVGVKSIGQGEPFAAFAFVRELAMPALLDLSSSALERQQLMMEDARQSSSRLAAGSDLHPSIEPEVVHDLDAGERKTAVRNVAEPPAARGADPRLADSRTRKAAAQPARCGEDIARLHTTDDTRGLGHCAAHVQRMAGARITRTA